VLGDTEIASIDDVWQLVNDFSVKMSQKYPPPRISHGLGQASGFATCEKRQ
jgi:hypothetical protein